MALLEEIGDRLSTQGIASSSGESGWYLALSWMPDSTAVPNRMVAVIETGGGPSYAGDNIEMDELTFQVRVRGESVLDTSTAYQDARAKIEDVKQDLHGLGAVTLGDYWYPGIWAIQEPFLLQYDVQDRPELAMNFRALRSRTT